MITILSVLILVLGILLVIAQLKEGYDKASIDKYNKIKYLINLGKGSLFAIIGLLAIFKLISEKTFLNLMIISTVLNMLIDNKIKAK